MKQCYRAGCAHGSDTHIDLPDAANAGKCTADGCLCASYLAEGAPGEPKPADAIVASAEFVASARRLGLTTAHFADMVQFRPADDFLAALTAAATDLGSGEDSPEGGEEPPDVPGIPFRAVLLQEGVETSDDRFIEPNACSWRTPPLPLMAQLKSEHGGSGDTAAELAGRIDEITRQPGEAPGTFDIVATGILDADGHIGLEVARLIAGKFLQGVSADLAVSKADIEITAVDDDGWPIGERLIVVEGELGMATITPFPAFGDCQIELLDVDDPVTPAEAAIGMELPEVGDRIPILASFTWHWMGETPVTITAAGGPLEPPRTWFERPAELKPGMPLTVCDDGRVYGYAWGWQDEHTGYTSIETVRPPRDSDMTFPYFHTGVTRASDGTDVPTGKVTFKAGHASTAYGYGRTLDHYDNSATPAADVVMGTDEYGAWFAGALRPGLTPEDVREIRSTGQVSGDWRQVRRGGPIELLACHVVPVPGFPQVRLSASGAPVALVAAGVVARRQDPVQTLLAELRDELAASRRDRTAEAAFRRIGV